VYNTMAVGWRQTDQHRWGLRILLLTHLDHMLYNY
jgi:hypothetical protein